MKEIMGDRFVPRDYQIPIMEALINKGYKRIVAVLPRRAGKDLVCWNLMIRKAIEKVGVYYYCLPTYAHGRKVIWDSITNAGVRFLDFIDKDLIHSTNAQEMKVRFINGSIIQIVGSDNVDALVGSNPQGVVFSEYAISSPVSYQFIRPILTANDGWALFISTPRGKNHLYDMYQIAIDNPNDWFGYKLTLDDTKHIPLEEIERERQEGIMTEDLIQQEYFTSWTMGVEGSFYSRYLDKMRLGGQIGQVPYETGFKVHTSWDIGVRDSTTVIFFQQVGMTVRIIDCYENSKVGLEHYVKVLQDKPYIYGVHIAPHDIRVREFGSGMSRLEQASNMGIDFEVAPNLSIMDGIEAVRSMLSKTYIDQVKCRPLINALENYRQEYDAKRKVYSSRPLHDFSSHFCDSMRYMALSLPKTQDGLSSTDIDRAYKKAMYGEDVNLPPIFRGNY